MEVRLFAAPAGFEAGTSALNKWIDVEDLVADMAEAMFEYIHRSTAAVSTDSFLKRLASEGVRTNEAAVRSAVNSLEYIFRAAIDESASAQTLTAALKTCTGLLPKAVEVVAQAYSQKQQSKKAADESKEEDSVLKISQLPSIGRLISLDWTIGIRVASSCSADLAAPYVLMKLRVSNPDGGSVVHNVEASVAEFQAFYLQVLDMRAAMDS